MKLKSHMKLLAATVAVGLSVGAGTALAQDVVKLGYSGPLSGGAALYGKNVLDGMQMAASEINAAGLTVGGKKVKLEIVALDDKYNPAETAINAQRLIQEHKAPAILVPHSGGIFALMTNNEAQKYMVLGYTSVPQLTARNNKLALRIPPDFTSYIPAFVNYSMTRFGKNLAFAHADHDYAKAWTAAFKPAWEAAGGKVVIENPMSYNRAADFYSGVSRAVAAKPDVMFVGGASEPTGLVIKQARELGYKGGFIVIDQAKFDEIGKVTGGYGALEGAIGVLPLVDDPDEKAKDFVRRFTKIHPGRTPSSEVSLNYTAVHAFAKAMSLAGTSTDATAIRAKLDEAFKALSPAHNPNTMVGVDARGGSLARIRVATIENGKVRESTVSSLSAPAK